MLNALQINQKKNYTLSTLPSSNRRNFEDSGIVLAFSVSQFYQSIAVQLSQPRLIRWLSLLFVRWPTRVNAIKNGLLQTKKIGCKQKR